MHQRILPAFTIGGETDSIMSVRPQSNNVKGSMHHRPRSIGNIRPFLDQDTCIKAVLSLVVSRLDYAKSFWWDSHVQHCVGCMQHRTRQHVSSLAYGGMTM